MQNSESKMRKYKIFLLFFSLMLKFDPAFSMFGQGDVPLEDYYEYGKNQTGVGLVITEKFYGTANLIDVGIEALKGRLMITCAHVIEDTLAEGCSVRFTNEKNEALEINIQNLFFPSDYKEKKQDIGFILLKEPVDIKKFNPLKLNLTRNNESLAGKKVDVFGCSPLFGKANSHIVFRDSTPLRRGMTTLMSSCGNDTPEIQSRFYDHRGLAKIYGMTKQDEARKLEIQGKIETLSQLEQNTTHRSERRRLFQSITGLHLELLETRPQQKLLETIYYDDHFEERLNQLQGTHGLNKCEVMKRWMNLAEDEISLSDTFDLDAYQIRLYKPLPRLSAQVFHGDSGGAWVEGDEIVALSTAKSCKDDIYTQNRKIKAAQSLPDYFSDCEKDLKKLGDLDAVQSFLEEGVSISHATSIWSCKDWIQATLEEIVAEGL